MCSASSSVEAVGTDGASKNSCCSSDIERLRRDFAKKDMLLLLAFVIGRRSHEVGVDTLTVGLRGHERFLVDLL